MYTLQEVESSGKQKQYMLRINGSTYYIGELIRIIVESLTDKRPTSEITQQLNHWARGHYQFTDATVEQIIEEKIKPLKIFDENGNVVEEKKERMTAPTSGFTARWDFLKYEHIKGLLDVLKHFFHPVVFFSLLGLAVYFNITYFYELTPYATKNMAAAQGGARQCLSGIGYLLVYYPAAILILFIHELGHAASAHLFKAPPKSIGFGFYFIFPVLYTDVTEIWKINRMKRTIVNLGGIFFQLLINLILFYILANTKDPQTINILVSLIVINTATLFINFNPFFKFDGYWIYSDIFKLTNLRQQSNAYITLFLNKFFPKLPFRLNENTKQIFKPWNPFLILYTICNYAFWIYVIYLVIGFIGQAFKAWAGVIYNFYHLDFSACAIEQFGQTALITAMCTYIFSKRSKHSRGIVRNMIKQYKAQKNG
jgi:putative peptide zinc metalloprotease protein